MQLLNAAAISEDILLPAEGTIGQIKSIHADYINIITAEGIVALVRSGRDHIPFGIEVDLSQGWHDTKLRQEQKVLYLADTIVVGETLAVQGLLSCPRFSCQPFTSRTKTVDTILRLRRLQQLCYDASKYGGIMAYIGHYDAERFCGREFTTSSAEARIPQIVKILVTGILDNKEQFIEEGIRGLLGLGPGLTPSGDDFLLGFLGGIRHVQQENCQQSAKKMAWYLAQYAPQLTTFMSVEYIKYGVKGLYHQRFGDMIHSFVNSAEKEMINKACKLMQLGHFSGDDLLLGFVYGGFTSLAAGNTALEKGVCI